MKQDSLSQFRDEWQHLQCPDPDTAQLTHLARKIANHFIDRYFQNGTYTAANIDILCHMATFYEQAELNNIVTTALFGIIIEQLCDDFEDRQQDVYNRVMAQIVDFCRRLPAGAELDRQLHGFSITCWEDLYCRAKAVQESDLPWEAQEPPQRIYILSRVTIGADIAIVSVLIQRLAQRFASARIILIGGAKLEEIFGAHPDLEFRVIDYQRQGGLLDRFQGYHQVLDILDEDKKSYLNQDYIIIDPDSRISQLGVLPLTDMKNYFFFNSRRNTAWLDHRSMAERTNQWIDYIFGKFEFCYPHLWLQKGQIKQAQRWHKSMHHPGDQRVITINFGVGNNARKRLGVDFEKRLLLELLHDPRAVIFLDKGLGDQEQQNTQALLTFIEKEGYPTFQGRFAQAPEKNNPARLIALECSMGQIAALIGQSRQYIGYDSACQHIAAGLGIPCVTIFAGTNNPRFIRRWSACSRAHHQIVHVNTLSYGRRLDETEIVARVLMAQEATS